MAQGVVLGAAAHLVDAVVRGADHVELVGDLSGLGQRHVERAPVCPGEPQHTPVDVVAPRLGLIQQPPGGAAGVATGEHVVELALGHIHDQRAPPAGAPSALASEQGLIET